VHPGPGTAPARLGELSDPVNGAAKEIETLQFHESVQRERPASRLAPASLVTRRTADRCPARRDYGREDVLIRVCSQLEEASGWVDRRPKVHA